MNTNRNTLISIIGVLLLGAIVYVIWAFLMKAAVVDSTGTTNQETGSICTMDALQCPDGSWVGRSGPNCQFVCPIPVSTSTPKGAVTVEVGLNKEITPIAEHITVTSISEDSRCPHDVQCIQAGTVRVAIKIVSGMGTANEEIGLGKTVTTETESITFLTVRPEKESKKTIPQSDYRFVFQVVKR